MTEQGTPAGPPLAEFYADIQTALTTGRIVIILNPEEGQGKLWRAGVAARLATALTRELLDQVDDEARQAERDAAALEHYASQEGAGTGDVDQPTQFLNGTGVGVAPPLPPGWKPGDPVPDFPPESEDERQAANGNGIDDDEG